MYNRSDIYYIHRTNSPFTTSVRGFFIISIVVFYNYNLQGIIKVSEPAQIPYAAQKKLFKYRIRQYFTG